MRINRLSSLFAAAIMAGLSASLVRMAEDAPAASTPVAAPVTIEVPAEHESAVQRFVDLLKSGEQWVVDNVHAALTHFESFLTPAESNVQKGAEDATKEDTAG